MDGTVQSTVLLVEDDAATRGMLARHLRAAGYEVTPAESAEQVIFEVDRNGRRFDVVISDVHLPGTSGIDLVSYLLIKNPSQSILLITGDPDEALARDALSRGPVSYLLKPFELFELDAALRQAKSRHAHSTPAPVALLDNDAAPAGQIPEEWLHFVDERSYAGPGHADRVAKVVVALAASLPDGSLDLTAAELALAARVHELGRLAGPSADPTEVAVEGARMLAEASFPAGVVRAVRHLHERWDGTGGPDHLSASRIPAASQLLSTADSLDHYASAWVQAGMRVQDAVDRAVSLVVAQQGSLFSPIVVGAVHRERGTLRELLSADRTGDAAVEGERRLFLA